LRDWGTDIFRLFAPRGLPFIILPFFILIEGISFLITIGSLSVRLFANMMSGHVLLKVLFEFSSILFSEGVLGFVVSVVGQVLLLMLLGLETAVSLIQGYVFLLLISIYYTDMEFIDY